MRGVMNAVLLATALLASTTAATPRVFDPEGLDIATLREVAERGTAVIVDSDRTGLQLVTAGIVVDAPPQTVFDVAADYDHFKDFMPQVESAKVVGTTPDGAKDVEIALKFKFSVITSSVTYVARHKAEPPKRITYEYVGGDMKSGGGSYSFVPLDGGAKTLLFYSTISDLRSMGFLTRTLLKEQPSMEPAILVSTASLVASAVKARAEAEHKKKGAK